MESMAGVDVAILGAVPQEIMALSELLETCRVFSFRRQTIWVGKLAHLSVLMGTTGLGKVNAAITTASLLERFAVAQVWNVGCAGAYPEGPLRVGDVLVTKVALCGDEGVITQEGVQSVSEIGIPLVVDKGVAFFDRFPPHWDENLEAIINRTPPGYYRQARGPRPERAVLHAAEDGTGFRRRDDTLDHPIDELKAPSGPSPRSGEAEADLFRLVQGPSLTVGMASGDPEVASERFRRSRRLCREPGRQRGCPGLPPFPGPDGGVSWDEQRGGDPRERNLATGKERCSLSRYRYKLARNLTVAYC